MKRKKTIKEVAYEVYSSPKDGAQGLPHSDYYRDEDEAREMSECNEYWRKIFVGRVMIDSDLII